MALIHPDVKDFFQQFSRNGRWGTCSDCPRNPYHVYPEFCPNTERYDHQLDIRELVLTHQNHPER